MEKKTMKIDELYQIIADRKAAPQEGSYTNYLFDKGEDKILKKVGEEAMEVLLAAKGEGDQRLIEEVSDLTYHLLVLLASRGITPADIGAELEKRHQPRPPQA